MSSYTKDADARLDYATDWSQWLLDEETITSHLVTITGEDSTLLLSAHNVADGVVTAWLTGGTVGKQYQVAYRITTDQGRTDERTDTISVKNR